MAEGFITLERAILNWEWYDNIPTKVLFMHCLLKANHKANNWRGIDIKRGQFITSIQRLSDETGLTTKQIRTALKNLEKTNEVGKQTSSLNTLISVIKYDFYQSVGKPKANEGQTKGKPRATNNNDNKENNENVYREINHLSLSNIEFEKLEAEYDKRTIDMVLDSIENYKDNKKYTSLYLTAKKWLSRELKKKSIIESDGWEQDFQLGDVMPNGATLTADVINHHQQTGLSYKRLAGL
jgi:hypothetical protein